MLVTTDTDGRILAWDPSTGLATRPLATMKHASPVQQACCNSTFVYTASVDLKLMQWSLAGDAAPGTLKPCLTGFLEKSASVMGWVCTEEKIYALYSNKAIEIMNAVNPAESIKAVGKLAVGAAKGDYTGLAYVASKNELWVCDSKGFITVLDGDTLDPVHLDQMKTCNGHPASCIVVSNDGGSMVAVGDTKGYTTILDTETKTQKAYFATSKSKVGQVVFSDDNSLIFILGIDKIMGLGNIASPSTKRKL